jgi:K+-sensing histidine kinase KdpD
MMTYKKYQTPRTVRERFTGDLMVTVGAILIASVFRVLLAPVLYDRAAFQLFTLAVMISAWTGGWRIGVLATVLASFVGVWLFVSPFNTAKVHDVQDIAQTLLFAVTGCGISLLAGKLHKARHAAETEARNATRMRDELSDFLESISECFQALDRKCRVLYINGAAERIIKRSAAEMIGQPIWDHFPATISAGVKQQLRDVMSNRTPSSSEYRDDLRNR